MHAIPEKLAAMRQNIEATMTRQMADQRIIFERQLKEQCKDSEDLAVRRAEVLIAPQLKEIDERLGVHFRSLQMRLEEVFPKIAELSEELTATRVEMKPLHARADAASARLDRLSMQTSTTTKDCNDLGQDFRDVVTELRAKMAAEQQAREDMDVRWNSQLVNAMDSGSAATRGAVDKADVQHKQHGDNLKSAEERLLVAIEDMGQRCQKAAKFGDDEAIKALRAEQLGATQGQERKLEKAQVQLEELVRQNTMILRGETESTAKRVTQSSEMYADQKSRELGNKLSEGLQEARTHTEKVREGSEMNLQESSSSIRKHISDTRAGLAAETDVLRQQLCAAEKNAAHAAKDAERLAIETSGARLEDACAHLTATMNKHVQNLAASDDARHEDHCERLSQAVAKLERNVEEMGSRCNAHATVSVSHAVTQINATMAENLQRGNERTDEARALAAESLRKESEARQHALKEANLARESVAADIRTEIRASQHNAQEHARSLHSGVDKRVDAAHDHLRSLERSIETVAKRHVDSHESLQGMLALERQRTEESTNESNKLIAHVRDTHETNLRNEVSEIRAALSDVRGKIFEEGNNIRAEMRSLPTKKDVADVSATGTSQYNELAGAVDSQRSRLEASVADFGNRCREVQNEAQEARLRMQRESIALGNELTQLRASSSSLANGLVKSLICMGLLTEDAVGKAPPTPSGGDSIKAIEIEDLLEWEKVGKSLSTRVSRNWYHAECHGSPTMIARIETKASAADLAALKHLILSQPLGHPLASAASTAYAPSSPDRPLPTLGPLTPARAPAEGPQSPQKSARFHRDAPMLA